MMIVDICGVLGVNRRFFFSFSVVGVGVVGVVVVVMMLVVMMLVVVAMIAVHVVFHHRHYHHQHRQQLVETLVSEELLKMWQWKVLSGGTGTRGRGGARRCRRGR